MRWASRAFAFILFANSCGSGAHCHLLLPPTQLDFFWASSYAQSLGGMETGGSMPGSVLHWTDLGRHLRFFVEAMYHHHHFYCSLSSPSADLLSQIAEE